MKLDSLFFTLLLVASLSGSQGSMLTMADRVYSVSKCIMCKTLQCALKNSCEKCHNVCSPKPTTSTTTTTAAVTMGLPDNETSTVSDTPSGQDVSSEPDTTQEVSTSQDTTTGADTGATTIQPAETTVAK